MNEENEVTPQTGPGRAAMSLEEELFGTQWSEATCRLDAAQAYFTRRFGFVSRYPGSVRNPCKK